MSKVNLVIDQGTTFTSLIDLTDQNNDPLNVVGYSARAQLRKHHLSANAVMFSTALANGQLIISLTANQTSSISAGRHVYDVELQDPFSNVIRVVEGIVTVTPEVSK